MFKYLLFFLLLTVSNSVFADDFSVDPETKITICIKVIEKMNFESPLNFYNCLNSRFLVHEWETIPRTNQANATISYYGRPTERMDDYAICLITLYTSIYGDRFDWIVEIRDCSSRFQH